MPTILSTRTCLSALLAVLLCACAGNADPGVVRADYLAKQHPQFAAKLDRADEGLFALDAALEASSAFHAVIYFGTWCHDSEIHVSHLIALLERYQSKGLTYELYALDHRKKDPAGRAHAHRVFRTPTVILEAKNQEIGRIVERPNASWAKDIAVLINRYRNTSTHKASP